VEIPRAFVCAESKIFDVSEWAICQVSIRLKRRLDLKVYRWSERLFDFVAGNGLQAKYP